MRNKSEQAQTLPDDQDRIETGPMGACVCAIVMWDYDTQNRQYEEVKGFHGNGGIQAVNWTSLFAGAPDTADTRVWILCGPENSPHNQSLLHAIAEARQLASQAHFAIYHGIQWAVLDRKGKWIEYLGQRQRMSHQFTTPAPGGNAKTVDDGSHRQAAPKLFNKYDFFDPFD